MGFAAVYRYSVQESLPYFDRGCWPQKWGTGNSHFVVVVLEESLFIDWAAASLYCYSTGCLAHCSWTALASSALLG